MCLPPFYMKRNYGHNLMPITFELASLMITMISSCTTQGPVNCGKEDGGWFPSTHDS